MSMPNQIHEFDPVIYPRKLWIAVNVPFSVMKERFEDIEPMDDATLAQVDNTHTNNPSRGGVLIRFENRKAMTVDIIAHESSHAAMDIFDYVGATLDTDNQEPFAYLCGWIAKCINEVKMNR